MTEEHITKIFLKWLISHRWEIICFDFPQSGTGRFLHPNSSTNGKNILSINPDIVAVKDGVCLFFENKDHFYYPDYEKQHQLITNNQYTDDISKLLGRTIVNKFYYGVGIPSSEHREKSREAANLVDFVLGIQTDNTVVCLYNPHSILF